MRVQDSLVYFLMDSVYGGNETRAMAMERNVEPVVPAHPKRQ